MIFVIMGMEVHPFDRLARAVDELARTYAVGEEFFVQLGTCRFEPRHARFERFLSFGDVCEQIRRASVAVTHAGAGSTLLCIEQGKHPVMVPRRSSRGERRRSSAAVRREVGHRRAGHGGARDHRAPGGHRGHPVPVGSADALGRARELTGWLETFWRGLA